MESGSLVGMVGTGWQNFKIDICFIMSTKLMPDFAYVLPRSTEENIGNGE
jgi:hypothetical protein